MRLRFGFLRPRALGRQLRLYMMMWMSSNGRRKPVEKGARTWLPEIPRARVFVQYEHRKGKGLRWRCSSKFEGRGSGKDRDALTRATAAGAPLHRDAAPNRFKAARWFQMSSLEGAKEALLPRALVASTNEEERRTKTPAGSEGRPWGNRASRNQRDIVAESDTKLGTFPSPAAGAHLLFLLSSLQRSRLDLGLDLRLMHALTQASSPPNARTSSALWCSIPRFIHVHRSSSPGFFSRKARLPHLLISVEDAAAVREVIFPKLKRGIQISHVLEQRRGLPVLSSLVWDNASLRNQQQFHRTR
ncbi:hypothetical protein C8R45DRAFT_934082 [Mycena sanguinolenta]|nr:hypothetical protein C8R45DRAFT_934082 [Mycena sanguinolenta]